MLTKFDKYKKEILIYQQESEGLAVVNDRPALCCVTNCEQCDLFNPCGEPCSKALIKWLCSEEVPGVTLKEHHFAEFLETGWIARDKNGDLYHYPEKPHKDNIDNSLWIDNSNIEHYYDITRYGLFSFIQWTDKEPWKVEDLLELEIIPEVCSNAY